MKKTMTMIFSTLLPVLVACVRLMLVLLSLVLPVHAVTPKIRSLQVSHLYLDELFSEWPVAYSIFTYVCNSWLTSPQPSVFYLST